MPHRLTLTDGSPAALQVHTFPAQAYANLSSPMTTVHPLTPGPPCACGMYVGWMAANDESDDGGLRGGGLRVQMEMWRLFGSQH